MSEPELSGLNIQ